MLEVVSSLPTRLAAVLLLMATAGCTPDGANVPGVTALLPFASSGAPYSESVDIAIVSEDIACVIDSFESRIHCVDRGDGGVTVFGREGRGPGEFAGGIGIERGRDGHVVAMDSREQRLTFFKPDSTLVSETRLPDDFHPRQLRGDRLFGFKLEILNFTPNYVPMAADAYSGEVLWERTDVANALERECLNAAVGASMPSGGLVFQVCGNELAFFAHRDAPTATVVASPSYVEALPNERDVSAHVDMISSLSRLPGGMSASEIEAVTAEFREKPKEWLLKPIAFAFDDQNRLWAATTRDRDAFSYFDIWSGTVYAGAVRVRDRLMGFDIFGLTLGSWWSEHPVSGRSTGTTSARSSEANYSPHRSGESMSLRVVRSGDVGGAGEAGAPECRLGYREHLSAKLPIQGRNCGHGFTGSQGWLRASIVGSRRVQHTDIKYSV